MTRLTQDDRKRIITNAVNASPLKAARLALVDEGYQIADRIRIESLGGADGVKRLNKALADVDKLLEDIPDDVVRYKQVTHRKDYFYIGLGESATRQVVHLRNYEVINGGQYNLVHTSELYRLYRDWQTREESNDRAIKAMREEIAASISGYSTRHQLLKAWPEVAELLPDNLKPRPKANLPALKTDRLNKLIGLPTKGVKK